MTDLRHSSEDRPLDSYQRPSLAVDGIMLCINDGSLSVVLHKDPQRGWSLPGTFVHEGETLRDALNRGMQQKLWLSPLETFRQLHVFDAPNRDPRGWVFSVAHYALVGQRVLKEIRPMQIFPIEEALSMNLAFDHAEMLSMAVSRIRDEHSERPDPWNVLGNFTLSELRDLHVAVDPRTPLRDSFRRLMEPQLIEVNHNDTMDFSASKPRMGRPSRTWRVMTVAERLQRLADKETRRATHSALTSNRPNGFSQQAGSSKSSRLDIPELFTVEFSFSQTGTVRHENLREREAFTLFDDFLREAAQIDENREVRNRPQKARVINAAGKTVSERRFTG